MNKDIIFFYTEDGSTEKRNTNIRGQYLPTKNKFVEVLKTDSYLYLLEKLIENKIVNSVKIIIVSNRSPGFAHIGKYKFPVYVFPNIWDSEDIIKKKDILFYRGGFRSWHDFIIRKKEQGFFNMLYAANTGREKWPFWDLILEDLNTVKKRVDNLGRIWFPFSKPVNQGILKPDLTVKRKYDICIGASHIHDKKGQWRAVNAIINDSYLKRLKYVMPGSKRRGLESTRMYKNIEREEINVDFPGMVGREELSKIYNASGLFVYGGRGGQNDRSLLESLACGTDVMFIKPARHAHFLKNYYYCKNLAHGIFHKLARPESKKNILKKYNINNGIQKTMEQFKEIIEIKLDKDKGKSKNEFSKRIWPRF